MDQAIFFSSGYIIDIFPCIAWIIALILTVIVYQYLLHRARSVWSPAASAPPVVTNPQTPHRTIPDIQDKNFELHAMQYIESIIRNQYTPQHTWAHTPKEIYTYSQNQRIYSLMHTLETSIYTQIPLWKEERIHIQRLIKNLK